MGLLEISYRENYLRSARFSYPKYIPATIAPFYAVWNTYRWRLEGIVQKYPILFPYYDPRDIVYSELQGIPYTNVIKIDAFNRIWRTRIKGYIGEVIRSPLDDWSRLKDFRLPDSEAGVPTESGEINFLTKPAEIKAIVPWNDIFYSMERAKESGRVITAWLPHGFLFLRLAYLRGWKNLFLDMYRGREELYKLVDMLVDYYLTIIKMYRKGPTPIDVFYFGDDLGGSNRLLIKPTHFREYIYPAYRKIFSEAKTDNTLVYLHTDGHTVELWSMLLEAGVDILNPQDKPNALENMVKLKGRVAINLDLDRELLAYGKPCEVRTYISKIMELFKDPKGGFMIYAEIHPPSSIETIEELAKTLIENIWI